MTIKNIEHFLLYANDIEKTKDFYVEILGLNVGYRPAFRFPGYWLYANNLAVVHLVAASSENVEQESYLARNKAKTSNSSSPIDHIAFHASDYEKTVQHLEKHNIQMRIRVVPLKNNLRQIFIQDPNGVGIELNFRD